MHPTPARIGMLILIGVLLLPAVIRSNSYLEALGAGVFAGIALAFWGASQTRYLRERDPALQVRKMPATKLAASMVSSPWMFGLFYVLVGYYVCYYGVVLWKYTHLTEDDLAV